MCCQKPDWVVRDERSQVTVGAAVRLSTGRTMPVTIIDKSREGCKVRCFHSLPIGEIAQLEIPASHVAIVSVRWSIGGRAGLQFV